MIAFGLMLLTHVAQARDIASFTDSKGTLHITNLGPKARGNQENTPDPIASFSPPSLPPKSQELPAAAINQAPAAKVASTGALQAEPRPQISLSQTDSVGIRPVTFQTGGPGEAGVAPGVLWSPTLPDRQGRPSKIVAYRDSHGVMHITNAPPEQERPVVPAAMVVQRQGVPTAATLPAVQEVSCPELGPDAVAYLKTKLQGSPGDLTGSTIQQYRDPQGIWRVFNLPQPEQQAPPPQVASGTGQTLPAAAQIPPAGPILPVVAEMPAFAGVPIRHSVPTVIARRDPRGVLHIFNDLAPAFTHNQASPAYFLAKVTPLMQTCIIEAAQLYQLPVPLILALIRQESNFVQQAISPKGAMGLMQLMPGTAASLGVQDPFNPRENILAGCRYFRFLLDSFQGNLPLALASYNAGSQRVISAGFQVPAIKETQEFVTQVMGIYSLLEKHLTGL